MCLGLIALEGQETVATTADDLRGDLGSAGEGIQADQAAAQVQAIEQIRQRRQLASLRADGTLRQHQPVLDRERADQVQGRAAVLAVERPPHGLAVDRDLPGSASIGPEHRADPVEKAALEALRVDQHQHAAEGVVRGDKLLDSPLVPSAIEACAQKYLDAFSGHLRAEYASTEDQDVCIVMLAC